VASGTGTALAVSVLRVEQRVGVSPPLLASPPVLASLTRTRHGSSGTIIECSCSATVLYCVPVHMGWAATVLGLFMCWTRFCVFFKGNEGLF
jgi:hypothetical protein